MAQFLIFDLYGPMAAWGEIAVGEVRTTADHPTRSALLGLIAAALGITRDEENTHRKLARALGLAVRLDLPGEPLRDYHSVDFPTGKGAKKLRTRADEVRYDKRSTMLTNRDYRLDAVYTVCLWHAQADAAWSLSELAQALQKPAFPLFLGRKSCPLALPLRPEIIEASTVVEALSKRPFSHLLKGLSDNFKYQVAPSVRLYWRPDEDQVDPGVQPSQTTERWDEPISRARWQFIRKNEAMAFIEPAKVELKSDSADKSEQEKL